MLAQADEALALRLREEHEEIVRPLLAAHEGREVKSTGDGFLAEFSSALRAVQCAIDIQRHLADRNSRPGIPPIQVRIGIHLGDVEERGGDIFGDSVNVASRIEPLAEPGGICITEPVFGQVRNKIPNRFVPIETASLKGVQFPVPVYRVEMTAARGSTPTASSGLARLAVLPFANISPDPQDEYFADGMTEEMISALSRVGGLRVISRTSVMKFKSGGKTVSEIGRELGIDTVLEGSVRKAGASLRVTVQLIDVRSDEHLWSEEFNRTFADVFEIQSEISDKVARALALRLRGEGHTGGVHTPTEDLEAYTLYLRGRREWNRLSVEGFEAALRYYERALERDSSYGLAYAGIADCYWSMGYFHFLRESDAFPRAKRYALEALHRDERLPEAHATLGVALVQYDWKPSEAEAEFRRALELNPSLALGHLNYASYLVQAGRAEDAVLEVRRAVELDPLSVLVNTMAGYTLNRAHEPEQALARLHTALELDPNFPLAYNDLGWVYEATGRFGQSIEAFRKAVSLSADSPFFRCNLALAYARAGQREPAAELLRKLEAESSTRYVSAFFLARVYARLQEPTKALELLERAAAERAIHWNALMGLRAGPEFESVRADPRFRQWLSKLTPPGS